MKTIQMSRDTSIYEDLQVRLRGIVVSLGERFATEERAILNELVDADECAVALEMMIEMVDSDDVPVPEEHPNRDGTAG